VGALPARPLRRAAREGGARAVDGAGALLGRLRAVREGARGAGPEARQSWLGRAGDEFKKALEKAPEDFDTRYNHELTQRLLQETKKQPKTPPAQLMQMLRPKPKEGQPPPKRVG
jgi:hypothetical protein